MWQLVINGPGYFDTRYDLAEGPTQVGRADENEVVLSGDLVSRRHGRFHQEAGTLVWEDLGSRNGSRVNGQTVTGRTTLSPHDVVSVGDNTLRVEQPTEASASSTEMVAHEPRGGGTVRRFDSGRELGPSVVAARQASDSDLLKAVDHLVPFDVEPPPTRLQARVAQAAEEEDSHTDETALPTRENPVGLASLALLFKVAEALATAKDLKSFLNDTTALVMARVGARTGVVLLRHPSGMLVPAAVRHSGRLQKGEVPVSDAVVDAALAQQQAIAVADVREDSRFSSRDSVVLYGVDQVLCVPIGQAPSAGVLYLNRSGDSGEPLAALLDTCVAIAQLLYTGVRRFEGQPAAPGQELKKTLERFHGPDQLEARLEEVARGPSPTGLEDKLGTVLFAELALTPHLVGLEPARVSELINTFHRIATQLVFSFGGTVVRCTGDGLVAWFGGATARGDAGIRAVRTAVALRTDWQVALARLRVENPIFLKAGLHTGKLLAGLAGFGGRLDAVVLGETPQLAALVCTAAGPDQILVTAKTLAIIGARFDVAPLGERALSGSKLRTALFEVLDEDSDSGTLSGVR